MFRYKTIGNAHIGPATAIYLEHARDIRQNSKYSIASLRKDLSALMTKAVPDSAFEASLVALEYRTRGGNSHIRYLLTAIEDYFPWYEKGAQGIPKCSDKSRVFDFTHTTLEHVYPNNAPAADRVKSLEKVKHLLGNLTVFGPNDNDKLANKPFAEKKKSLEKSNLRLNRELASHGQWKASLVRQRSTDLAHKALAIFRP